MYITDTQKPRWYTKYEEMLNENGEQLEIGAELETHGKFEEATGMDEVQWTSIWMSEVKTGMQKCLMMTMNLSMNSSNKVHVTSVIEYALSELDEVGCIYSKDLVAVPSEKKQLKAF